MVLNTISRNRMMNTVVNQNLIHWVSISFWFIFADFGGQRRFQEPTWWYEDVFGHKWQSIVVHKASIENKSLEFKYQKVTSHLLKIFMSVPTTVFIRVGCMWVLHCPVNQSRGIGKLPYGVALSHGCYQYRFKPWFSQFNISTDG